MSDTILNPGERNGLTADQLGQSRASLVRSHLDWLNQQNDDLHDDVAKLLTRCEALAIDVAWRAAWMTRVVNLLGALRDDLGHELTESGHLAELEQAFRQLEELGLTRAEIEARTGCSQPMISVRLRLLELTPEQQQAVHDGRMSLEKAKAAFYALGRRAPDRAPRKRRRTPAPPVTSSARKGCPHCGHGEQQTFAPRERPVVDMSLPPVPPADRDGHGGQPGVRRVLMCDDCEFWCELDQVSRLIRHAVAVHGRPATRDERRPAHATTNQIPRKDPD